MKLYKYVSMAAARSILERSSVGFSQPKYFNDPFDQPTAIPVPAAGPESALLASVGAQGKSFIWGERSAILSLTRNADNPLMWAHYADAHRGAVIAFDTGAAGWCDEARNLIPAHFGSVIYVRRFYAGSYMSTFADPVIVGQTQNFVLSHYEKWQRLFLTKPLEWAYEEEVRVVKCISGISGNACDSPSGLCDVIALGGRDLYTFRVPPEAILEIHLGVRAAPADLEALQALRGDLRYFRMRSENGAFSLVSEEV